jgi:2-keto-4-pentenoate hydratase/2-oxohepta-3-ene-1,7-dioic acid hydratase in catechol pathway
MRYAKLLTPDGPLYVEVEDRDGTLFACGSIAAPEEDPLPHLRAAVTFRPAPLESFSLLSPVRPPKIVCVGRNYREHAAEMGDEVPKEPLTFLKAPSSLLPPGGTILLPPISSRVDFEGEIAIVIGRRCHRIGPDEDILQYIRGYTLVNDVSARDLQKSDGQWTRAKGYDTFCPVGPLVSDQLNPATGDAVTLTTRLNGEVRQQASTADLIFPIPELLRYITSFLTLEPGDLIPTGTPSGVGPLQAGDVVEVEMAGLGVLRNQVAAG